MPEKDRLNLLKKFVKLHGTLSSSLGQKMNKKYFIYFLIQKFDFYEKYFLKKPIFLVRLIYLISQIFWHLAFGPLCNNKIITKYSDVNIWWCMRCLSTICTTTYVFWQHYWKLFFYFAKCWCSICTLLKIDSKYGKLT